MRLTWRGRHVYGRWDISLLLGMKKFDKAFFENSVEGDMKKVSA
jgi:hypothetical protein